MQFNLNRIRVFLMACLAWAAEPALFAADGHAVIEGTVTLPPAKVNPAMAARYQGKATKAGQPDPPAAVVYLEGNFSSTAPGTGALTAELGQKNLQFSPALLPVQTGTAVRFPNYDDEYHNVLSFSKAKSLDLGRYLKSEKQPNIVFDKPGVVDLHCEIHAHMRATILVLDTPYFAKTAADGKFRLEKLPAGQYTLKAWVNAKTQWSKPVQLKSNETVKISFPAE